MALSHLKPVDTHIKTPVQFCPLCDKYTQSSRQEDSTVAVQITDGAQLKDGLVHDFSPLMMVQKHHQATVLTFSVVNKLQHMFNTSL